MLLCINTFASPKINQYSTGLFVSYSTHGKTQLYESIFGQTTTAAPSTTVTAGNQPTTTTAATTTTSSKPTTTTPKPGVTLIKRFHIVIESLVK
jgi:hypothetical protein